MGFYRSPGSRSSVASCGLSVNGQAIAPPHGLISPTARPSRSTAFVECTSHSSSAVPSVMLALNRHRTHYLDSLRCHGPSGVSIAKEQPIRICSCHGCETCSVPPSFTSTSDTVRTLWRLFVGDDLLLSYILKGPCSTSGKLFISFIRV